MKKILFFYPDNPLINNQGNNARALELLHFFKKQNYTVDFVGETQTNFSKDNLPELKKAGLVDNAYILRKRKKSGLIYMFKYSIAGLIKNGTKKFNRIGVGQQKEFENILRQNKYDYIIISYVLFAPLIENKKLLKGAKTIVDTHDFFTAQFNDSKNTKIGANFKTEIKLLNKFDFIWTISCEEQFIFSQFLSKKSITTIPHGVKNNAIKKNNKCEIDIFYVGSNNPHNTNSAKWFFSEVYPLLNKSTKITVVGRVNEVVPDEENITKIEYADDLGEFYEKTRITICPMLSGTGLKIKVVESLSYGIPVVCNERGVDGLLNKINNGCLVTNNAKKYANYIDQLLTDEVFYTEQSSYATKFFIQTLEEAIVSEKLIDFFS